MAFSLASQLCHSQFQRNLNSSYYYIDLNDTVNTFTKKRPITGSLENKIEVGSYEMFSKAICGVKSNENCVSRTE